MLSDKMTVKDSYHIFQGCHDAVVAVLKENIQWVIVAALVIAFLQVGNIGLKKH